MHINPKFLLQLVEIAERGSFTEAAESLCLTQPALSRNMKELEAQIGAKLLIRDRHGARLTEFGRRALPYAQAMRKSLERISIEAESWQHGRSGSLLIGITPHPASLLPKFLAEFLADRRGVTASMTVSGILPLIESLGKGELDLIIGPVGIEPFPAGIVAKILFTDELALFAGASHPLARKPVIDLDDLRHVRWVGTPSDSLMRRRVASVLSSLGLTEVRHDIVMSGIESALEILETGNHLAVLPRMPARAKILSGGLVELPVALPMPHWSVAALYPEAAEASPLVLDFVHALTERFG